MEAKDVAFQKFSAFLQKITDEYWDSIDNEAETRKRIIDPIFSEIMSWPEQDIHLESQAGSGFIDYRLTVNGLNRLIVEAKKHERELGLSESYAGRFFKINGSVFNTPAAKEGIEQAVRYCGHKNAELACITNGRQWFIFRGNRLGDGKDTLDGLACCFSSLEAIKEKFSLFYDLLSFDAVSEFRFRAIFQEAEGQPLRTRTFRAPVRVPESRTLLPADKLHADIDRIMVSFFQDLSGEDDPEARKACFVRTDESNAAEQCLLRISDNLRNSVRSLSSNEGAEITEAIKRVHDMKRKELVLLIGTKSAGKSTFIDRFFEEVLPKEIADDTVVIRINFASCGCDAATVLKWLNEHFLDAAEQAAFKDGAPSYEDIEGMYWKEYDRLRKGSWRHQYERDKDQFKIDFGKHIESRREERPQEYITHLLHRIVNGFSKVPCLVFDNADHFDVDFQEEVFKYAHALYKECLCLVLLPITDTTSWVLAKEGAIQSFYTESLFLPTPPTELVLHRRVEYIEAKIQAEKPEQGKGYFFGRGIPFSIDNIKAFVSCLQTVFLETSHVANWIGRLANQQIRRSLQLTREIITSPHIGIHDLVKSYTQKTAMFANPESIKMAIIRGKYDIYSGANKPFVHNIFNLGGGTDTTPLLGLRVLQYTKEIWEQNQDNDSRYISLKDICNYFHTVGIEPHVTRIWVVGLFESALLLAYNPQLTEITDDTRLEISPSGRQHVSWGQEDWVYLEAMAEVTPLLKADIVDRIKGHLLANTPYSRREAIRDFIDYLVSEDAHYCKIPQHDTYLRQTKILDDFKRQKSLLDIPSSLGGSTRYARFSGTLTTWKIDKGYGFIRRASGETVFVHKSNVVDFNYSNYIEGALVEFDVVQGSKGEQAVKVVCVNKRDKISG